MMNGNTMRAFRKYEDAVGRLKAIVMQLETDAGREAVISKLSISLTRYTDDGPALATVGAAIAEAMKADAPKYFARLINSARADVLAAAEELRSEINIDLASKFMKAGTDGK